MRKIEDVILKDGRNLKEVLELHKKWLEVSEGGERVDLSDEDLSNVNLSNLNLRYIFLRSANLSGANLKDVNLTGVNLTDADLTNAYLIGVNLTDADLTGVNLSYANLAYANLRGANLKGVNLRGTDLTGAYLEDVNLSYADLRDVYLSCAYLKYADLTGANLTDVDLKGANLTDADLTDANLTDVKYNHTTSFFALQCPEKGSFIGYKKANDKIVELLITEDAKRSSATTRKCRCDKAKVLSITSLDGKEEYTKVASNYDINFVYEVGKVIEVKGYDENRWNECSTGIHFFITRDEAVMYRNLTNSITL